MTSNRDADGHEHSPNAQGIRRVLRSSRLDAVRNPASATRKMSTSVDVTRCITPNTFLHQQHLTFRPQVTTALVGSDTGEAAQYIPLQGAPAQIFALECRGVSNARSFLSLISRTLPAWEAALGQSVSSVSGEACLVDSDVLMMC